MASRCDENETLDPRDCRLDLDQSAAAGVSRGLRSSGGVALVRHIEMNAARQTVIESA